MEQIWQSLWNAGIPLFLLCVGIVVVWRQWRDDMALSAQQREDMVKAINALTVRIEGLIGPKT